MMTEGTVRCRVSAPRDTLSCSVFFRGLLRHNLLRYEGVPADLRIREAVQGSTDRMDTDPTKYLTQQKPRVEAIGERRNTVDGVNA
jgi:hypothetical protein